jgi:hypothetical protein
VRSAGSTCRACPATKAALRICCGRRDRASVGEISDKRPPRLIHEATVGDGSPTSSTCARLGGLDEAVERMASRTRPRVRPQTVGRRAGAAISVLDLTPIVDMAETIWTSGARRQSSFPCGPGAPSAPAIRRFEVCALARDETRFRFGTGSRRRSGREPLGLTVAGRRGLSVLYKRGCAASRRSLEL